MTIGRPLFSRINVVFRCAHDIGCSIAFYRDLLGLPFMRDEHEPAWAEAKVPGRIRFALLKAGPRSAPQTPGTVVIDFETDDLEGAVARLRAARVRVRERDEWGSAVEVFDPDGYRIGLFEPPKR